MVSECVILVGKRRRSRRSCNSEQAEGAATRSRAAEVGKTRATASVRKEKEEEGCL
jgi:hypothetical protein